MSQGQADFLAKVAKQLQTGSICVPLPGSQNVWRAESADGQHGFFLHMRRSGKVASQVTTQERYETNEILPRLDTDGRTHTNPDDTVVPTPHLHVYMEGFDDKWAFPLPEDLDVSSSDAATILVLFLKYCGIGPIPPFQTGVIS